VPRRASPFAAKRRGAITNCPCRHRQQIRPPIHRIVPGQCVESRSKAPRLYFQCCGRWSRRRLHFGDCLVSRGAGAGIIGSLRGFCECGSRKCCHH
jgi:hypothetical protein